MLPMGSKDTPLAKLRAQLGLTQGEFGDKIGLKQPSVSFYESGKDQLTSPLALKIWRRWRRELVAMHYTLEDLLREGEKH
jgi:DNA-binding XRE family transcriptional regulator